MSRGATKKNPVERRKKPRNPRGQASKASKSAKTAKSAVPSRRTPVEAPGSSLQDACSHCSRDLKGSARALFVEEDVGRVFCSEKCITGYFGPEIQRLEKEYMRRLSPGDLSGEEREALAHLRFITLQEADEVWREKTLSGDHRYTLISEFEPGSQRVWCVCICLFLRGEPSFLYIAFTTRNEAMVNAYRRGERVRWEKASSASKASSAPRKEKEFASEDAGEVSADFGDRLADAWTENETFLAQMGQARDAADIPPEEYELFQSCLEETLEAPDEVWSMEMAESEGLHLYHFIRHYSDERPGHWYVILARETEDEEQIEIIDAFPTRDAGLVERYRRGTQEVGEVSERQAASSRLVH